MGDLKVDIWMPVTIGDHLKEVGHLNTEEHGAYCFLLIDYWVKGKPLPDNDQRLANTTKLPLKRWKEIRDVMAEMFAVQDGIWRHERLEIEMRKAKATRKANHERGKKGAEARWGRGNAQSNAQSMPDALHEECTSPSPPPSQSSGPEEDASRKE